MLKPLYRIVEAGTYWWATYSKYYKEKLLIIISIFNPYFLIIIILKNNQFLVLKEDKLVKINLIAKLKEKLSLITLLLFNRYIFSLNKDSIALY